MSSSTLKKIFLNKSEVKAMDMEHKRKLSFNIQKYSDAVVRGKTQFSDLESGRKKAKNIKWKTIENLDKYLLEFEKQFIENGGHVIWARDGKEANEAVLEICKKHNTTQVVKSKSMVTEEIHLNDFLEKNQIESVETDLGEYIQQLDGEPPYHIVTPAMHKSKEDVAKLFHEKLGVEPHLTPNELTLVARKNLREKYVTAQVGVTGGNFLLADIGGVCVTENEGNGRLTTSFPKVHIAIVGIEKLIPSIEDLNLYWPLLATYGTGQKITVYNSIFTGPKKQNEIDGPQEMYVILLDNGRTNLIKDVNTREAMYCIRCGACLNVCPVYKNIGGHTYGATYSGPIGSVITPHLKDFKENVHLSYASSLCGACTETCPVKINIHGMLHYNRTLTVKKNIADFSESTSWKMWRLAMTHRKLIDLASDKMKSKVVNVLFKESWVKRRAEINFNKSFKQLFAERHK
ncbi:MAG TPA: LutB/LldF family L-lactate oxidation iron-sulfur protein [Chitinophagaceae bacterium]|nr:LutB/LldF family L-lactate oxidation iron-sulfur protein [Chitinophagaceae bacterium]